MTLHDKIDYMIGNGDYKPIDSGKYKYFKVRLYFNNMGSYFMAVAEVLATNDISGTWTSVMGCNTPMNGNNSAEGTIYTN